MRDSISQVSETQQKKLGRPLKPLSITLEEFMDEKERDGVTMD
jgi:hypothetical protein